MKFNKYILIIIIPLLASSLYSNKENDSNFGYSNISEKIMPDQTSYNSPNVTCWLKAAVGIGKVIIKAALEVSLEYAPELAHVVGHVNTKEKSFFDTEIVYQRMIKSKLNSLN